ncbi:MAG: cadmium-translocating P-type ATPase [Lachnospiraceae bacterium]|nr:cadmium-translocating P-type ATPase [Lachnospiraceae bacterium]
MEEENRKEIFRIVISVVLIIVALLYDKIINVLAVSFIQGNTVKLVLCIIAYLIAGFDVLINAFKRITKLEAMDETVLMSIATIGAIILGEYQEAVAVMVFYQIGELFQDYSYDRSKDSIKNLVDIKPEYANVFRDNVVSKVNPADVKIGETILVNPYEKIPLDGEVIDGSTTLNTSALTGESIPRFVTVGDSVSSGLINNENLIKVKTTKEFKNSTASKIMDLIENATEKKSTSENFITSFAKIYTPIVCLIAVLVFLIPISYQFIIQKISPDITTWAYRALTILVISCPCAILISVPLAFFSALGSASKLGILVKGSNYIEELSKVKTFVFDKTGTMTKGVFEVVGAHHLSINETELFRLVSHIEFFSNHPIAKSILRYYGKEIDVNIVKDVKEIGGRGLSGVVDGKNVLVGNDKLMQDSGINYIDCRDVGTIVHVAIDNQYAGHILITDIIKDNAEKSISLLKKLGISKNVMLTGDRDEIAKDVSEKIGLDEYHANLLPDDKLSIVEKLIENCKLAFVGDGINDAPCITRADVGFAMGAMGSDSAIDLADIVIMDDDILKVVKAYKLGKITMRIVFENVTMSIGIKVLVLILSIFGISNMWLAVFSDVGVMVLAVINSIRLLYVHTFINKSIT